MIAVIYFNQHRNGYTNTELTFSVIAAEVHTQSETSYNYARDYETRCFQGLTKRAEISLFNIK